MSEVCVVGVAMTQFGRYPDQTVAQIGAEAVLGALDDADISLSCVEAFYCGNLLRASSMVGQSVLRLVGQTGIPVVNCTNACATGATAFREGWMAVQGGLYETVLCLGVEQMGRGLLGGAPVRGIPTEGIVGSNTMPAVFALVGQEHAQTYGTTFEQFAQVAVKNHHHATMNPKALYRRETPLTEVMSAEMIATPNTKLMCSPNVDGAAAALLTSKKKAKKFGRAVSVRASVLTSDPYTPRNLALFDFNTLTREAAKQAYEQASCAPEDLSLVELHDCFATAEIVHYENLQLCPEGQGGPFIDSGDTALGGRIPVNVSGGLLSKGHPLGATGIANIYEVVTQLRGEAGKRQVQNATLGLTHVVGLGSACAIHILERTQ